MLQQIRCYQQIEIMGLTPGRLRRSELACCRLIVYVCCWCLIALLSVSLVLYKDIQSEFVVASAIILL